MIEGSFNKKYILSLVIITLLLFSTTVIHGKKLLIKTPQIKVLSQKVVRHEAPIIDWHKSYNGSGEESHPHYVIQTSDLGFLMVGETGFVEDRTAKIFLVKTDQLGKLIWKKEFGKRGYNLGNFVLETRDGHYLVAGSLNLNAALIKVDARSGNEIWTRIWNLGKEDAFESVTQAENGDIWATGYRDGLAEGTFLNWGKGLLIKTNSDGKEEWKKDLLAYTSSGYRIKQSGGHFLLACHPKDEESADYNLLQIDQNGKINWAKTYHTVYWGFDTGLEQEILLAGHTRKSNLSKNWDIELTSLNQNGEVIWTRFFGQPRGYDGKWIHDEVWGARSTPDGGWLAVAGTGDETQRYEKKGHISGPSGQWKIYLVKVDRSGTLQWEGIYGSNESDWAGEDVCITADGGALVANDCGSFGFTKISPWMTNEK